MSYPDPPVIGERQLSNHDCVPASLASALQMCGRTDQVADIAAWLTANGWDTSNGVTIEHAAAYCTAIGVPYDVDDGTIPMVSYVPAALAAGFPVIGFHQCNGDADPVPVGTDNIEHCRLFYGNDASAYQTMNPWPPDLESVATAAMDIADVRVHLTLSLPVIGLSTTGDDMGFTVCWSWPQKKQPWHSVATSGDGHLIHAWWDPGTGTVGKEVLPSGDVIAGTLSACRDDADACWNIYGLNTDGTFDHWYQYDVESQWRVETVASGIAMPPSPGVTQAQIQAIVAAIPAAQGGLTAQQASALAQIPDLLATVQRIEAALKGA